MSFTRVTVRCDGPDCKSLLEITFLRRDGADEHFLLTDQGWRAVENHHYCPQCIPVMDRRISERRLGDPDTWTDQEYLDFEYALDSEARKQALAEQPAPAEEPAAISSADLNQLAQAFINHSIHSTRCLEKLKRDKPCICGLTEAFAIAERILGRAKQGPAAAKWTQGKPNEGGK